MNATLKTLILAAAGAALIAASPASAQTNKRTQAHRATAPVSQSVETQRQQPGLEQWQSGEVNESPAVDTYGQIRDEYLKDGPTHNGNSY